MCVRARARGGVLCAVATVHEATKTRDFRLVFRVHLRAAAVPHHNNHTTGCECCVCARVRVPRHQWRGAPVPAVTVACAVCHGSRGTPSGTGVCVCVCACRCACAVCVCSCSVSTQTHHMCVCRGTKGVANARHSVCGVCSAVCAVCGACAVQCAVSLCPCRVCVCVCVCGVRSVVHVRVSRVTEGTCPP